MSDVIKMRNVTHKKGKKCTCCKNDVDNCLDLFDIKIKGTGSIITLCDECMNKLFMKSLKAVCSVNARIKSNKDMTIIHKRSILKYKNQNLNGKPITDLNKD